MRAPALGGADSRCGHMLPPPHPRRKRGKAGGNHLEERLLDQAQAQALYTPPFLGVIRVAYPKA